MATKIEITVDPADLADVYAILEAMEKAIEASWKAIHESRKKTAEFDAR